MNIEPQFALVKALISHLPGLERIVSKFKKFRSNGLGTDFARYCYSVWLRHLSMAHYNDLPSRPQVVVELGPGPSLGAGIAAPLSSADSFYR